jgi:transcriptional regulator with XRE-family HTH domain
MATKSQHANRYEPVPGLLRSLREEAGLTQSELGKKLGQAQQWIHNSETMNRRVDVAEFIDWAKACEADPIKALRRLMRLNIKQDDSR